MCFFGTSLTNCYLRTFPLFQIYYSECPPTPRNKDTINRSRNCQGTKESGNSPVKLSLCRQTNWGLEQVRMWFMQIQQPFSCKEKLAPSSLTPSTQSCFTPFCIFQGRRLVSPSWLTDGDQSALVWVGCPGDREGRSEEERDLFTGEEGCWSHHCWAWRLEGWKRSKELVKIRGICSVFLEVVVNVLQDKNLGY